MNLKTSKLIDDIRKLKIINIEKTRVNVGRDDSYYSYYFLHNFSSRYFRNCLEESLKKNHYNIEASEEFFVKFLLFHDRVTVDRTAVRFNFIDDTELFKLWLLDIMKSTYDESNHHNEDDQNLPLPTLKSILNIKTGNILSLSGNSIVCHYISKLSGEVLSSEKLEVSTPETENLKILFENNESFSEKINGIVSYFETLNAQRELKQLSDEGFRINLLTLREWEKGFYKERDEFAYKNASFSYSEMVYTLDIHNKPIFKGIVLGYNKEKETYIVGSKLSLNSLPTKEVHADNLVSVYKYHNPDSVNDDVFP